MRIIAQFKKIDGARYISHLDLQRAVQRALRRSGLPVQYTQGFSPHQVLSFASALSLGFTSVGEVMDVAMAKEITAEEFHAAMEKQLPPSLGLVSAAVVPDGYPGLMALVLSVDYRVQAELKGHVTQKELEDKLAKLLGAPILTEKKTKAGIKQVEINEQVLKLKVESAEPAGENTKAVFFVRCDSAPTGALNPKLLFEAIKDELQIADAVEYCRLNLWGDKEGTVPLWKVGNC